MIRLYRDDEDALTLIFNKNGSIELEKLFTQAFQEGEATYSLIIESFFDKKLIIDSLTISDQGFPAELGYNHKHLEMRLDREIIDFCIMRFQQSKTGNEFFPAEIADFDYNGHEITLYAIFEEND
ncbi:hypothetical protein FLK61_31385 [Paenalkalicoccus suaedae]|uniref:Uncharacterized protein n=1 Tax=Paenalkalicoccus suaedae TaxID=2592382 RepID=A0A859FG63_9BACI|nr:hypothetical protein [Paenalkalicoccus suaedae]QKS71216.1 hypothetical protein FLK61_31385 [Paenalkalicoccus suaedae]